MRKTLVLAVIGALAAGAMVGGATIAMAQGDPIAERKENRKQTAAAMRAIKGIIDAKGATAGAVEQAAKLKTLEASFVKLFPAGSDKGDTKAAELRKHRHTARGEDDFIVVTAQRLRSYLDTTLASVRAGLFLLMAVVFAVAALGIGNVMLSGVNARRREIAIKRAIGASRGGIFLDFLAEAVILTGFGGVLGVVLGAAAAWAITATSS